MIYKDALFSQDTINIFTDASITKVELTGETIGCSGYIVVRGKKKIYEGECINRATTNNNSEAKAIALGVEYPIINKEYLQSENIRTINLFSDSQLCIFSIREWYLTWLNTERNGMVMNSSGDKVSNQEIFNYIIWIIMNYNICINFYHQKGHVCLNSAKSLYNARDVFISSNKIHHNLDIELIKEISKYNDYIDNATRFILKEYVSSNRYKERPISQYYTTNVYKSTFDVDKYKKLIR